MGEAVEEHESGIAPESQGGEGREPESKFDPITNQEEFDKRLAQRLGRERAKFSDYDALKAKAAKLDEIEAANKSELQKLSERADAAEKRAEKAELESLRAAVASEKGVPASSLIGRTREELEAGADELIAWRDKNAPPPKKVTTATSGGGLKSGAAANGGTTLSPKAHAAEQLRRMRAGN
ncbi:hypothetical protein BKG87_22160 [Mycobacteroides chelonae]|nr:hypothetical protein BKG87_22160 [Mycobacteroides chelonae]